MDSDIVSDHAKQIQKHYMCTATRILGSNTIFKRQSALAIKHIKNHQLESELGKIQGILSLHQKGHAHDQPGSHDGRGDHGGDDDKKTEKPYA